MGRRKTETRQNMLEKPFLTSPEQEAIPQPNACLLWSLLLPGFGAQKTMWVLIKSGAAGFSSMPALTLACTEPPREGR